MEDPRRHQLLRSISPDYFRGIPSLLYGLAALALLFGWIAIYVLIKEPQYFDPRLIPLTLLFAGAAWTYWWWHERRPFPTSTVAEAPPPPRKVGPATPEETLQAERSMKVARAHIADYWELTKKDKTFNIELQLQPLHAASKSLQKAASLDPNATITVADKEGNIKYTQDAIGAEILYLEALS